MASVGSLSEEKKVGDGAEKALSSKVSVNEKPVSPLSSETPSPPDEALKAKEKDLLWKIDYHLIPILFALYMFAFLDRVNIGNAKIQGLTTDLKMNGAMYNVASEILFVPYILLEVPSNLIIKRIRPSYWLSGLMFFWGITTVCQGVVSSYGGLLVCRVFLGVFEAGIFPGPWSYLPDNVDTIANGIIGCAYLISMYYKRFELQRRLVLFFTSSMLAGAFGGASCALPPTRIPG
jgi:MFS family permease